MQKKNDAILEQVIFRLIELSLREITYLRFEGVTPAQLPQPRRKTYLYDFHIRVGGHRLRYSAMICPDISIHRLNERIRNFETLKKSKHPLILTPELSKPQQHNFIGRGISFIDCLGNVFLVYDKPQIYFQNAFKARGNSANFHVFRSTLFSDRASVIARSLFQAPDESLSDSSETESSATAKAALAIWKKEMADSYGLFRDEASLLLRAFFNKDKELSQAELSRMTGLSKAEVSRIIRIISQKYFLSANPKNRRLYRILSAHKLLRDWIDYYRQVKVDFREYWVD